MGIQEMHIAIDVLIQKINSNSRRDILPEEKDLVLNWAIQEFISDNIEKDRVDGDFGFHNDEVNSAALTPLLKQYVPLSVFPSKIPSLYEVKLPADFRNFLSFSAITIPRYCFSEEDKLVPETETITNYIYTIKVPDQTGSGPFFTGVSLSLNSINGSYVHSKNSEGTYDSAMKRYLYLALQELPFQTEIVKSVSWEKFPKRLRQKDTIIIETTERLTSFSLNVNGAVLPIVEVPITETRVNRNHNFSSTFSAPSKRIKPQYLSVVESSTFDKSKFNALNITLEDNVILIPNDEKFLVTVGMLNYIRKPAEVNLSLGIDCDLPDTGDVHNYICAKAAEELMLSIESPNWQARFETNKLK